MFFAPNLTYGEVLSVRHWVSAQYWSFTAFGNFFTVLRCSDPLMSPLHIFHIFLPVFPQVSILILFQPLSILHLVVKIFLPAIQRNKQNRTINHSCIIFWTLDFNCMIAGKEWLTSIIRHKNQEQVCDLVLVKTQFCCSTSGFE